MSYTTIPAKVRQKIWLQAGGRCQYPGCNEPLWKDTLTLRKMNRAYLAHIVADRPNGPRGHPLLSEQLKADFSNIMLLCDAHHRLIDNVDEEGHPPELLRKYKQEHEERIERQTSIQTNRRTHVVLFGTRIGEHQALVNYEQACEAVLPERYPADDRGICLDLANNEVSEEDPEFWQHTIQYIERRLRLFLDGNKAPSGKPLNHLSIFALAPVPALIHFGKQLGDIVPTDVYQRQRSTEDWQWKTLENENFQYILRRPELLGEERRVAINLSLSGTIRPSEIKRAVSEQLATYTVTIDQPHRDFLRAKEQLELFRPEWYKLLAEIREVHGEGCEIHLFPAVPCSVAVEIGRALLPKTDPSIVVYDHNKNTGGFSPAIIV